MEVKFSKNFYRLECLAELSQEFEPKLEVRAAAETAADFRLRFVQRPSGVLSASEPSIGEFLNRFLEASVARSFS